MDSLTCDIWILCWSGQWKRVICYLSAVKHICQSGLYPQNGLDRLKRVRAGGSDGLGDGSNHEDLSWGNLWAETKTEPGLAGSVRFTGANTAESNATQAPGSSLRHLPNVPTLSLLDLLSPSVLLVPPSSSWPHRTWSARLGWGPGWETAACRSTALPHPHWIWSERKHLREADRGGSGWQKTGKQPCTFTLESVTHQICLCSGSDEGLHSWTLRPEASVECWPPTWEWWGSRSRPLQGQHARD